MLVCLVSGQTKNDPRGLSLGSFLHPLHVNSSIKRSNSLGKVKATHLNH